MSDTLKPLSVKTGHLATKSVTSEKIADKAIENKHIKEGSVTPDKLTFTPVSRPINPPVESSEIKNGAITPEKVSFQIVTRPLNPQISTAEIRDGAITKEKMADGIIGTAEIANGAVTNAKIAANTITGAKIAANAVGSSEIAAGAVSTSELSTNSVTTEKIANGAVTAEKLAPGAGGGDRFVFGTLATPGMQSADVLYLTDVAADIPYTVFDLSAWIPANAKGVILQLGMFNQAFTSGRAFFRVRTNTDQRDALGVGVVPGGFSQVSNQGIVPLVVGTPSIEYALESVGGPWVATLTLYVTVVGYIV